jgi:hypothetical protein
VRSAIADASVPSSALAGSGTVTDAATRTGSFKVDGSNGSSVILYSRKEAGRLLGDTLADIGQAKYNKAANGGALNLSINIDNHGKVSLKDYVASMVGDRRFDNVIFSYHGGAEGQANANMQALFGPGSDLHSVLSSHTTGSGVVLYATCYGIAPDFSGQAQVIANTYQMNTLTASYGPVIVTVYELSPTIPNGSGGYTSNGGSWNVASPTP